MNQTLLDVLRFSSEAAVLLRQGRIVFANHEAKRLLGADCEGAPARPLLMQDDGELPEGAALLYTRIGGEEATLRVRPTEEGLLVFLERERALPALLNDAFLYQLRDNLQTVETAAAALRPRLEEQGDASSLEALSGLTRGALRLTRLVQNAALARELYSRELPFSPQELDLSLLCHAALDAAQEQLPALALERDIPEGLRLVGDARLLRQLFFNLLSNALLHGEAEHIRVTLRRGARQLLLTVADDGRGIPEERLASVFSQYRGERELSEMREGVGLGLSAARAAALLHGGTLLLESREQRGTLVRVSLSRELSRGKLSCPARDGLRPELCGMRELQIGLADCLPASAFRERYMD